MWLLSQMEYSLLFFVCRVWFLKTFPWKLCSNICSPSWGKKVYPRHKLMLPAIVLYDIFTWFDYIPTQICHRDYKWQTQPTKTVFITCFARIQICHQSNWKYTCPVQTNECKWGTCYICWPHLPSHRSAQKNSLHVCVCVCVCATKYTTRLYRTICNNSCRKANIPFAPAKVFSIRANYNLSTPSHCIK